MRNWKSLVRPRLKHLIRTIASYVYLRLALATRARVLLFLLSLDLPKIVVPLLAGDPMRAQIRPTLTSRIKQSHGEEYELTPHGVGRPLSRQLTLDEQSRVLAEISHVMDAACRATGLLDWWITYGTLLGIVRDESLLPSDDDFDVAYMSQAYVPAAIVCERREILEALRALPGVDALDVSGGMFSVSVDREGVPALEFDLFTAYRTERGIEMFMAPPGVAQTDFILPTLQRGFLDTIVTVPSNPEAVLAWLYGEGWSIPDPSYRARWFWPEHDFLRKEKLG